MSYHLTVTQPFGKHKRGAHITDPKEVGEVLTGPNQHFVVKRVPKKEHLDGSFYKSDEPKRLSAPESYHDDEA